MKKIRPLQFAFLVGMLLALVAVSALPLSGRALAARSEVVRLTVENNSSGPLYIWLTGSSFYYFYVNSEKSANFSVTRGLYSYRFRACGDTVTGTLDMATQRRIVMPVCGGRANSEARAAGTFDISSQIKIVKVHFDNQSGGNLWAILTGPTTYVFTFKAGEEKDYTIAKGDYTVKIYACGRVGTRNFSAFKGKTLELTCP
ncbi:MAG TPA: hypothetical protein VJ436_02140 [Anaerolineales bacterium]|nr:hypothetical protein [Anaerolineales bacterium]